MTDLVWAGLGVYGVVVAGWWFRHVLLSLPGRLGLIVSPRDPSPTEQVSVILPTRNERGRVGPCLRSLLGQGPVVSEVIVVDDRSKDGTGAYVRGVAGDDPRVRVLRIDALPPGWSGKAHACQMGAEVASSPWLLFTDADCRFLPGGVAGAVDHAVRSGMEFLTLWPRADHRTFWEHVLIPLCGAIILYWVPPLRAIRRRPGSAFANGQFILVHREAYQKVGGHESVREAVIEDIPLAERARRLGVRIRAALGSDIVSVRMYGCYQEIREGWSRIFIGALQRPWKLVWSAWSLLGGSLLPNVAAPAAVLFVAVRGWPHGTAARAAIILVWLHVLAVYTVSFRAWGLCRCDRRYLLLYPLSCLGVIGILLRSWWRLVTKRPIVWRDSPSGFQAKRSINEMTGAASG